jgi:hypothetical protein
VIPASAGPIARWAKRNVRHVLWRWPVDAATRLWREVPRGVILFGLVVVTLWVPLASPGAAPVFVYLYVGGFRALRGLRIDQVSRVCGRLDEFKLLPLLPDDPARPRRRRQLRRANDSEGGGS